MVIVLKVLLFPGAYRERDIKYSIFNILFINIDVHLGIIRMIKGACFDVRTLYR